MHGMNVRKTSSVYVNMRDPRFLKHYYRFKTIDLIKSEEILGSSPPDIFVGRIGYPDVYVGPLVPPQLGDTTIMGTPEGWVGKTIPEIVEMRSLLIRGMHKTKVKNVDNGKVEEEYHQCYGYEAYGRIHERSYLEYAAIDRVSIRREI